jgi:YebC/PmpR family DNA-binding regulatory protein
MSGHSKWSTIKHKKGAADAKRGKIFTKLIKEITVAAREGGGDIDANAKLRLGVQKAKDSNMPSDNIERAIKKGTGELEGVNYEEIVYEGYGTAGVALIIEGLTDNKNRTTGDVKSIFTKRGGNLAAKGAVGWIFDKKAYFAVKKDSIEEDKLMDIVLESGAEDLKTEDTEMFEIYAAPVEYENVRKALEAAGVTLATSELTMLPKNTVKIETAVVAKKLFTLIEALEDNDDVQNVYSNFDVSDEIIQELDQ